MTNYLLGGILGDIAGSQYEHNNCKDYDKIKIIRNGNSFTDDTVCAIAIADAIISGEYYDFLTYLRKWCLKYPNVGYGSNFSRWINNPLPYLSYGNGSAMRSWPIGFAYKNRVVNRIIAEQSALCSHNHIEGIKGAQCVSECVCAAYYKEYLAVDTLLYDYYPEFTKNHNLTGVITPEQAREVLYKIRPSYQFEVSCQKSVPIAVLCALGATDYEDCIKLAISMGGDSDTIACIAGSIAYAEFEEMPQQLVNYAKGILPNDILDIIDRFDKWMSQE